MTGRERVGVMLAAYEETLNSVPTAQQRERGRLSEDEIERAAELMRRLAAEARAERAGSSP